MIGTVEGSQRVLPLSPLRTPLVCVPSVPGRYGPDPMKTRTLIVLALLCGLALVLAFTIQIVVAPR